MELALMIEGQEGVTWSDWRELAQACEAHRIPTLFRSDHYMNLDLQHPERGALDAWATISALGAITTTLRLGTMVTPASFRHPSVLARQVLTADHVSGGRVELGIGAGWHQREHEAHGFPFAPTRVRFDVLEEQLELIHGAWSEGSFSFTGEHYRLTEYDAQPKPVQQPHPPVIMGGNAGPRSLSLAARFADEYNTVYPTLEQARERRERLLSACAQAGREPLPLSVMTVVITGHNESDVRRRVQRFGAMMGQNPEAILAEPRPGWIIGPLDFAIARLRELGEAGVSRVACQQHLHRDLEHVALIGAELAPAVA